MSWCMFTLLYTPEALVGTPIVRADAAAVGIECHYSRCVLFFVASKRFHSIFNYLSV